MLGDGLAGVDYDDCVSPDRTIEPRRRAWIQKLNTYGEFSPSLGGVKQYLLGELPEGSRKKDSALDVEFYSTSRFFAVTGHRVEFCPPTVEARQAEMMAIHAEVFPPKEHGPKARSTPRRVDLDDQAILDRAMGAVNGATFARLWSGDGGLHNGDASAGDLALCNLLAFWTGGDAARIDRMFRSSGRMRDKWDERHSGDGSSYGTMTVRKAVNDCRAFYDPNRRRGKVTRENPPPPEGEGPGEGSLATADEVAAAEAELALDDELMAFEDLAESKDGPQVVANPEPLPPAGGDPAPPRRRNVLIPGTHKTDTRVIEIGNHQFSRAVVQALPPDLLYERGKIVGRLVGEPGSLKFEQMEVDPMRIAIDRDVRLERWTVARSGEHKGEPIPVMVNASRDLASLVLADADAARHLRFIVNHPVVCPDGTIARPGHNPSGVYFDATEATAGVVPETDAAVMREMMAELLIDFPFKEQADRENVIGLLLTPIIRPSFRGNVPMHMAEASLERTGKTKLIADVFGRIITGRSLAVQQLPERDEEVDKRALSLLLAGKTIWAIDNATEFRSASLCSLLTSESYAGRNLGHLQHLELENTLIVVATANNAEFSGELAKRTVPIRLESATDAPEDRTDFAHPDLAEYLPRVRARVLSCLLGMIEVWRQAGEPTGTVPMGGFDEWARIVGGIMRANGYDQWMTNAKRWRRQSDSEGIEVETFIKAIAAQYAGQDLTATDLLRIADAEDVFRTKVKSGEEKARATSFAMGVLRRLRNRPVAGWVLRPREGSNRAVYVLMPAGPVRPSIDLLRPSPEGLPLQSPQRQSVTAIA